MLKVYNESFEIIASFQAHTSAINHIIQLPNGYVATCSLDASVKIWDPYSNWSLIQRYSNHSSFGVYALEYVSADTMASGDRNGSIHLWSISTGLTLRTICTGQIVFSLKILGLYLAAGVYPKVYIYNIENGSLVSETPSTGFNTMDLILLSSDLMAGANSDKTIRIWNLTTNNEIILLKGHTDQVWGVKLISCDILASGSLDNTSRLWNITDGTLIRNLTGHSNSIYWGVDLFNEQILVTGSYDQTIKLWNISTGEEVKTINAFLTGGIRSLTVLNSSKGFFAFSFLYNLHEFE